MNHYLDADDLRRRRHECRLTRRQLARATGLDVAVIENAERHGLPIYEPATLALAEQLGLDLASRRPEHDNAADSGIIGAILADIGEPLSADTIAGALRWSVDRVLDAADELRNHLNNVGQTLTISIANEIALAPYAHAISDELRIALHATAIHIDATAAALHQIITGRHDERLVSTLDDTERAIATHMIAAEILTEHNDELRLSNALEHAPRPARRRSLLVTPACNIADTRAAEPLTRA